MLSLLFLALIDSEIKLFIHKKSPTESPYTIIPCSALPSLLGITSKATLMCSGNQNNPKMQHVHVYGSVCVCMRVCLCVLVAPAEIFGHAAHTSTPTYGNIFCLVLCSFRYFFTSPSPARDYTEISGIKSQEKKIPLNFRLGK